MLQCTLSHASILFAFISLFFSLQEFNRAYNAYSAALKLSPVGPSSHGTFVRLFVYMLE